MSRWDMATLREVAESLDYGVTASATWEPKGPKFLRITDIRSGSVDWDQVPWCESDDTSGAVNGSRLRPGDILFARTGSTGNSLLIRDCPENSVFASYLIRVRLKGSVDPGYMSHFFQTPDYWVQIASRSRGAIQSGVNASTLGGIKFPLPPLVDQRRVAAILDRIGAIRAMRRETLARLDEFVQSVFLDMFGEINSLGGISTTVAGVAHSGQGSVRTGPFGSQLLHSEFVENGIAVLGIDNVVSNEFRWADRRFVTEAK